MSPRKNKKISHEQKKQVISLLRENALDSNQIAEMVGVTPPTVWAYKAQFTMGKYDHETTHGWKDDSIGGNQKTDGEWIPEKDVQDFIKGKIITLGNVESVNTFYNTDDQISKYARRIAETILKQKP